MPTIRYLLVELPFDDTTDPDTYVDNQPGSVGSVAEGLGYYLDNEPGLDDHAVIRQVYPGDMLGLDDDDLPDDLDDVVGTETIALGALWREVTAEAHRTTENNEAPVLGDYYADLRRRLSAMLDDVRGCSCGMADYGAPGHEGHDETGREV